MHRKPNFMHRTLDTIIVETNRLLIICYMRTRKYFA